jgi:hypothetical protein
MCGVQEGNKVGVRAAPGPSNLTSLPAVTSLEQRKGQLFCAIPLSAILLLPSIQAEVGLQRW